jgi:hypothetical protein
MVASLGLETRVQSAACIVPSGGRSFRMRLPFCILNVLGDVLDGGELHFVEAAQTLGAARRRIKTLAESRPGEYIIYDGQSGEMVPVIAEAKPRTLFLKSRFGKNTPDLRGPAQTDCEKNPERGN